MDSNLTSIDEQRALLEDEYFKCQYKTNLEPNPVGVHCPIEFDGIFCWPYVPAGHNIVVPCPAYVHGFNHQANASRYCTNEGLWWFSEETNATWTNYTQCAIKDVMYTFMPPIFQHHVMNIKTMAKVGYSISFLTLIVAASILASVRRLRCPRNQLHLQLFLSFIVRAFMFLLKDALYTFDLEEPSTYQDADYLSLVKEEATELQSVECKIFTSFWQYSLMANYSLILMEGLYLHNLIFLSIFTDASGIARYVAAGWGIPVIFVLLWVLVRALLENTLCWTTNENRAYFWIIRGPITASIIINFALFVNITRVLFLKLSAAQGIQARQYRYRKWFRSTLVLVPLFGVHYALLLAMAIATDIGVSDIVEIAWLYVDQLFSSFQGSVVAFLYCFLNGEVQGELRKVFPSLSRNTINSNKRSERERSFPSTGNSICTQSLTLLSRAGRCSILSLQSTAPHQVHTAASNFITPRSSDDRELNHLPHGKAIDLVQSEKLMVDTKY